jgi:Tfp pilus assembly protein PilF
MMKRLAIVLLSFTLGLSATVLQPSARARAREVWLSVKSQHFTLIGNADERTIRQVGLRLEQFRAAVARLLDEDQRRAALPVTVIVFKNDFSYRPFKPLYQGQPAPVAGYFQASDDAAYITLAADGRRPDPYAVIFHEYVHLLMSGAPRPLPTCLSEGIAEYYSSFELGGGDRRISLGRAIESHVRLLREQPLLPLATLFAVDQASPFYNEGDKKNLFYAEAWALVHYLMLGNEGKRQAQLRQFINALAAGQPLEQSFLRAFQTDYAGLERELRDYLQRKFHPAQQVMLAEKIVFDATMQTAVISEAEVQGHLGALLCRIERAEEGEAMLQGALALDARSATAHMALGMRRVRQERFREAAPHFQQAAAAAPQNHLAHYYHAYALQQAQADEFRYIAEFPDETVRTMRAALTKARALAPEFAPTYRLLAFINLVRNENLDEAVALLARALELAPQRAEFVYTLAQVHMRRQDYVAARRAAERVINSHAKPEVHQRAQAMVEVITQTEEQLAKAKAEAMARGEQSDTAANAASAPPPLPGKRFVGAQVRGLLVRIDCTESNITLTVNSEGRAFRFQTALGKLIFVRYTMEIPNEITCGAITPARLVIVTYQPLSNFRSRIDGTPIGVEFIKPETD